jgi:hypothetical protein
MNTETNLGKIAKSNPTLLAFLLGTTLLSLAALKVEPAVAQEFNTSTFTREINPQRTFINTDISALNGVRIDLRQLGINAGDTILLERFGYFSPFGDSSNEYFGSMFATFSKDKRLLPNNGSYSGATTDRVPGAINAVFPNGCSPIQCIDKIFYVSRGQDLVQGGFNSILVTVPTNAQFLFISAADSTYGTNVDLNRDFAVGISKVF